MFQSLKKMSETKTIPFGTFEIPEFAYVKHVGNKLTISFDVVKEVESLRAITGQVFSTPIIYYRDVKTI